MSVEFRMVASMAIFLGVPIAVKLDAIYNVNHSMWTKQQHNQTMKVVST